MDEYVIVREYMGRKRLVRQDGTFSQYGKAKTFSKAQAEKWIERHTYKGMSHTYKLMERW